MEHQQKKVRKYKRISAAEVSRFKALRVLHGNNTAAVRILEPTNISHKDRAYKLAKKAEEQSTLDFIDKQMQQIGIDAINRVGKLVHSTDEKVATKNAHYIIDHIRGQATKKSISLTGRVNIQDVLQ